MRIPVLFLVIFSLIVISGCRTVMVAPTPVQTTVVVGHPPLNPPNNYRYHYRGHNLVYDINLGAYVVLGFDGVYFYNDLYLRFYDGDWQVVERLDDPWHRAQYQQVPGKLRSHRNHNRHSRYDGPPPHAPAHGYRHHYRDVDMEYHRDLGAYVVLGFDDLYFYNNLYLRFFDGSWHVADRRNGHWRRAEHSQVPRGLWRNQRYRHQLRETPPPHAPANGYRHHYRDVDLVFDSRIGAYVVLGFDDLFFLDGLYMRFFDGRWHTTDRYDGRWRIADDRRIPRKLRYANSREKQGLYKRIKQQYKNENTEEREYRKKYYQDRNRDDKHDSRSGGYDNRSRNSDRNRNTDRNTERDMQRTGKKGKDSKGGLFSKVKKKAEDKEASKKSAGEKSSKSDKNDDEQDSDDREKRGNGNRF